MKPKVEELDLDAFLGHSGSSSTGDWLGKWKEDGRIDIWLHPSAKIVPLWSHNWYAIVKDRETHEPVLRTIRFNSLEREPILKSMHRRTDDGERVYPPETCPFSKLLEWVYQAIRMGELSWVDEIFKFDEVDFVIHAGGFIGKFNDKNMDREDLIELKRAGIRRDEAWKESSMPRLQYIFRVVKNSDPGSGCLIALESKALGDKVRKVIADRIDDVGRVKGDPFTTPYAIRWAYDDKASFADKFEARAVTSLELTPEIQAVFDAPPPAIDDIIKTSNVKELRQSFEAHWCAKTVPPWDEIFSCIADEPAEDEPEEDDSESDDPDAKQPAEVEQIECDVCHGLMDETQYTCPHCGTVYDAKSGAIVKRGEWPKPEKTARRRSGGK